jgi:hypothetical protein
MRKRGKSADSRSMAMTSLLLALVAFVGVTAVTLAWFTISDHARVQSMDMDVTAGMSLRFDLDAHEEFADYTQTLGMEAISARIRQEQGFDPLAAPLDPVTTEDGQTFTLRSGAVQEASTGKYLTFTLHFMATQDMVVHLSSANGKNAEDGTRITSETAGLVPAMRIGFTCGGETAVYDPNAADFSQKQGEMRIFGLPQADKMVYNENNGLFRISANTDTPVTVHIWIEGTDEMCTNELKGGDYSIRLRFVGTDENNVPVSG